MKHRITSCTVDREEKITARSYPAFLHGMKVGLLMALYENELLTRTELHTAITELNRSEQKSEQGRGRGRQ